MSRDQAALFDRLVGRGELYRYEPDALARLNALIPQKGRTLDVGCGDGIIAAAFDGGRAMGLDISPGCARMATGRGLAATVGDATAALPFAAGAFDSVYCVDVLHHLGRAWPSIFAELDRVLKPGGQLAVVEPDARNAFVRWTQAPRSPIRVAPYKDEPAIDPLVLLPHLEARGYAFCCDPIHIEGQQVERSVFPLWQRLLKAPFVIALATLYRNTPNKFAIVAQKPS